MKTMKRLIGVLLIAGLLCGCFGVAQAEYVDDAPAFRISCTVNGDTRTRRGLCWYTKTEVPTEVQVFQDGADVTASLTLKDVQCALWEGYYMHKVTLTGLTAGTTYSYKLKGDNGWSEPGTFTTDNGDDQVNLIAIADVQASNIENFRKGVRTLQKGVDLVGNPDAVLNMGDFTNDSDNHEWNLNAEAFDALAQTITYAPVAGNHDGLGVWHWFENLFCLDTSESVQTLNGVNYSFDYGNVHVAVVNTNDLASVTLPQLRWLKNDMNRTDKDWKIVCMHKSPYTLGKDGKWPDAMFLRVSLVPVLDSCGVDLVLSGHDHQYLRTKSLKGGKVAADGKGTTYVLCGTAGSKRYEIRDFLLGKTSFLTTDKIAAMTVQKGGKDDLDRYHTCYFKDGTFDNIDLNRVGGVFNTISVDGGKLTFKSYVLKDLEEGETEDVLTEIDSFELQKETGKNKSTFSGSNTTSPAQYALGLIPSAIALAAYAFGSWLPRFFAMMPKLVYTYITKGVF